MGAASDSPQSREASPPSIPGSVGKAIRARRIELGLNGRSLAEQAGVSASLISQIETEKIAPSVGSLVNITRVLGMSIDEIFFGGSPKPAIWNGAGPPHGWPADRHVGLLHPDERAKITLETGCHYERLTPDTESKVDFTHIVFEPGGASSDSSHLMRHPGREYGLVLSGILRMTIGFDEYELNTGDSIVFNGEIPHRAWNPGDEPGVVAWMIVYPDAEAAPPGPRS